MRNRLNHGVSILALAFLFTMFGVPTAAIAQSQEGMEHGQGHNKDHDHGYDNDRNDNNGYNNNAYNNNSRYQQGMNEGQHDRQQNRARRYHFNSRNDQDRQAYQAGYDRGYESWNGLRGDRGNDQFGRNSNPGFRMGYTDGSTDGQNDRRLNKQQKYGLGYKHPDRGYVSSYGDKDSYKQQYRVGYEQGYNEGYGR
jgi:hypothetical protein